MDIDFVRRQFPALDKDFIFMDNAGGSQTLDKVIQRVSGYLVHHNVQLGASYKISEEAGKKLNYATKEIGQLVNASRPQEMVMGPSTSMLFRILSICLSKEWKKGDEVIITDTDHEANISCWTALQEKGIRIKTWEVNKNTFELELEDLQKLLNSRTKLVAVTHASNILGNINPIKKIAAVVHQWEALLCVDGVAYAPHRKIDVQDLEVDFYCFSWYKTYGPHLAVMYGKYEELLKLDGINHSFFTKQDVPYKFQPGNYNFELTYSLLGITEYYQELFKHHFPEEAEENMQQKIAGAFSLIESHEEALSKLLLEYLNQVPEITIIGSTNAEHSKRVPTISFVHQRLKSDEIVEKIDAFRIGIRFGDFYAKKLIATLGLKEKNGVVRVSLVHYNTKDEVKRLIWAFKKIF